MDNIGEILKNTRLDKGLSLEQVEEATSIRKIYLAAIETGDYAKIPGDVFTKGIIRTYGNYLGLNGPELVTLYKAACAGVDPEEIKPAEIRTTSKISVAPHLKPQKNSSNIFTYLLSFVLLVIIDDTAKSNEIPEQEKAKIEADAKKAKERAEQAAAAKAQKTPADNKQVQQKQQAVPDKNNLNLYMFCNDRCWVEVTVDGEKVFEGTLVSNQEKNFSADKKIIVKYGNIKAMQIAVNGKPAPAEKVDGVVIKEYKK